MVLKFLVALTLLLGGVRSTGAEYELYLLAGQSNMDGRGKAVDLSDEQRRPSEKTIIFYRNPPHASDGWQPLAPGFSIPPKHKRGIPAPTFGPEIAFAAVMERTQPARRFALVKGSKGGTSLRSDWKPGIKGEPDSQGAIYRNFIATVRLATEALTKAGHTFHLRGLLWHQGESDVRSSAEEHHRRLVEFAARIREDLAAPKLPIVVGEVFDNGNRDSVRTALRRLADGDPACALVSSEGTTTWDPGTHFDARSQLLLGRRYAEAMLRLRAAKPAAAKRPPNVILAMADDMGWMDLSSYGNDRVATPHIDRLAKEGIRLTQYYAASAVCTPTRASVLTGKYPLRFDIRKHFTDRGEFLPTCHTLPKLLKTAGYQTAHVGKWHLGGVRVADAGRRDRVPGPREHGFDHWLTQQEEQPLRGRMGRERTLFRQGGTCLLRNDQVVGRDDPYHPMYLTDIWGDESVRLIEEFNQQSQPFFLNLWWLTPHKPYEPAPEPHWSQTAAEGISDDQHRFRSMMARMDYNFGKILDTLDRLQIADNTIVVFVSDNGGAYEANIGELKGGKTDLHEGGIRVCGLFRWPGHIPGGAESDVLGHSNDLLPTLCAAAGVPLPKDATFDGKNILPLLTGKTDRIQRGTVFWQINLYKGLQRHYPKPKPYATEIAREGKWKLLAKDGEPVELFDVESDIYEKNNVLAENPQIAGRLQKALKAWLAEPRTPFGDLGD